MEILLWLLPLWMWVVLALPVLVWIIHGCPKSVWDHGTTKALAWWGFWIVGYVLYKIR